MRSLHLLSQKSFSFFAGLILLFAALPSAQDVYTGVWRSGNSGYYLWAGVSWSEFNTKWSDLGGKNLRLINIKGSSGDRVGIFSQFSHL